MNKTKPTLHKEVIYPVSLVLIILGVLLMSRANFGIAPCEIPAYVIAVGFSKIFPAGSFGYNVLGTIMFGDLLVQSVMLIVFCLIIRRFRPFYLFSYFSVFVISLVGYCLQLIPVFDPAGGVVLPLAVRIVFYIVGFFLTVIAVSLWFHTYFYPQVYTFVPKGLVEHFHIKREWIVLLCFDVGYTILGVLLNAIVTKQWNLWGEGCFYFGTITSLCLTAPCIGLVIRLMEKLFTFKTLRPKWEEAFEIEKKKV